MGKFNINLTSDGWGPVLVVHSVTFTQAGSCAQFPVQNQGHLFVVTKRCGGHVLTCFSVACSV